MYKKFVDIFVLIGLLILAIFFAIATKNLYIGQGLFVGMAFLLPPVFYMGLRSHKNWKKIIIFTLIFGGLFGFILDFMAELNLSWTVTSSIFPFKLFGVDTLDSVLGLAFMALLTATFYEHFIDRERTRKISKNLKYALLPSVFVIILILILHAINPEILKFRYPYLFMGLVAIIWPIILSIKHPPLIKKMLETAIYFFFLYFVFEIVAVNNNFWIFQGNNYVGWVEIFKTRFPFEELFFWMMFYAATLVAFYEIFVDDER